MHKLLIVEDELIEREGLKNQIDWERMNVHVVDTFESAEKALDFMSKNKIDILLTDIKLIKMNGLELAQRVTAEYPEVKVIIISCFEEFEFAKKAIDYKAFGYLTKPIDLEELENVFSKVTNTIVVEDTERLEKERLKKIVKETLPILRDRFLNNLISGPSDEHYVIDNMEYFGLRFAKGLVNTAVLEIDNYRTVLENKPPEEIYLLSVKVLECMNSISSDIVICSFGISTGKYCTLFNSTGLCEDEFIERISLVLEDMQKNINETCKLDVTAGIGKCVKGPEELRMSYKKACDAVDFKFFTGPNQIINQKDIHLCRKENSLKNYDDIEKGILSSIELCDSQRLISTLDELFGQFGNNSSFSDIYIRNICINLIAKSSVLLIDLNESFEKIFGRESLIWDKIMKYDTIIDLQMWLKNIFIAVIDYLSEKRDVHNKKIIKDIFRIIEEKYNTNLTINDISKQVYLSANYISAIFRKTVGRNFTDYLVHYRLEKARQLLKETNYKVYQIGNMVGYGNTSHFCSIFKHIYGVSPNEYRDKS